ncbi:MAG TPA: thioesterase family protein [Candidatus Binatia bacterium]|nr:thioesterase family protein [Candidatus Binatia bacterium]
MADAFFAADGDAFVATGLTRGPWSAQHQHAGPPAALLARAVERALPEGSGLARLTVEILRPLPIAAYRTATQVLRAGRKVQWLSADLLDAAGERVARAHAVAMRVTRLDLPVHGDPLDDPLPDPAASQPYRFDFFTGDVGYHTAMELRLARGTFGRGRVAMWMRMRHPLVSGEAPSPVQRVLIAADSGNGVSMALDPRRFSFVNPDLTVYLHRPPAGEWVCLDARTIPQEHGIGLADTRLLDEQGPIGRSVQSLLIEAR